MHLQHAFPPSHRKWDGLWRSLARSVWFLLHSRDGQEVLGAQTTKAIQQPATLTIQWLGRQGRGFIRAVGLSKQRETDVAAEQVVRGRQQTLFRSKGTKDEVRMFGSQWQELARCLHGGMKRLDGDLRWR
jgi:hypothetical protein